jgi:lysophospholipase L1-like esterase
MRALVSMRALGLAVASVCVGVWPAAAEPAGTPSETHPTTIAALGTSLTRDGGWVAALEEKLRACGNEGVRVLNFGGSGETSEWGRTQIERVAAERPDVLLIEFAINDAHLLKGMSRARARENIEVIVTEVRRHVPSVRVLLLSMNPVHGLRGWARPLYNWYNDDYGPLASHLGAEWIDLRPVWIASGLDLADAIPDGVHPQGHAASEVGDASSLLEITRCSQQRYGAS